MKEKSIHLKINEKRKEAWNSFFDTRGLGLSEGIRNSVEFYISFLSGNNFLNDQNREYQISQQLDEIIRAINNVDVKIHDRLVKMKTLDYDIPSEMDLNDYDEVKEKIMDKMNVYGEVSIPQLSQLLDIDMNSLLLNLKRMREDGLVKMNDNFEWGVNFGDQKTETI